MKLQRSFYEEHPVEVIAKKLLGKHLVTCFSGEKTSGLITEVEAYSGRNDKACHANNGLRTGRTEVMYSEGGKAYVYLCYGIHHMLNVVTSPQGLADAVLIRSIQPIEGIEVMFRRRGFESMSKRLTSGPGNVGKALGLNTQMHNGADLLSDQIWIEERPDLLKENIISTKRIGIDYAEEDALKPWRFYIKDSKWVSKK